MSVVNKMLQDLEARKERDELPHADYQPPAKPKIGLWAGPIVLFLLIVAGAGYWYGKINQPAQGVTPIESLQASKPASVPVDADEETSNAIKEIESRPSKQHVAQDNMEVQTGSDIAKVVEEPLQPLNADDVESNAENETEMTVIVAANDAADEPMKQAKPVSNADSETKPEPLPQSAELTKTVPVEQEKPEPVFTIAASQASTGIAGLKQQAQTALQLGDSVEARKALGQLLVLQPDNLTVRKKLAALDFASGQTDSAYALLREGVELHPGSTEIRLMLARLLVQNQQKSQALDVLLPVSPPANTGKDYLAYRAALAEQLQQNQQALQDYRTLASQYPQNSKWWLGLAISQERSGDKKAALLAYKQVNRLGTVSGEVSEFVRQRMNVLSEVQ